MITIVLGEHTAEELRRLGMSDEEIQKAYDRTLAEREAKNDKIL